MNESKIFTRRIDFIWPSIAIYLAVILIYSIIRGSIHQWEFTVILNDPLIILFSIFIILSAISYLVRIINALKIVVTDNQIIFKTRINERKIQIDEIESISFKLKALPDSVQSYSIITIVFKNKSRSIHIWPPLYYESDDLMVCFEEFKTKLDSPANG